jgi:hypothetical protein
LRRNGFSAPARLTGRWALVLLYVGALALLGAVLVAARLLDRPYSDFTRDPVQVLGGTPIYIGLLSNLGILLWAGAAAACLVAAETLRRIGDPRAELLLAAGLLTALLVVDDIFLFHERSTSLDVPQAAVALVYAAALGAFVGRYRRSVLETEWWLLLAAALLLGLSAFLDWFAEATDTGLRYDGLEDAIKFVGVVTWTAYFARLAVLSLVAAEGRRQSRS